MRQITLDSIHISTSVLESPYLRLCAYVRCAQKERVQIVTFCVQWISLKEENVSIFVVKWCKRNRHVCLQVSRVFQVLISNSIDKR